MSLASGWYLHELGIRLRAGIPRYSPACLGIPPGAWHSGLGMAPSIPRYTQVYPGIPWYTSMSLASSWHEACPGIPWRTPAGIPRYPPACPGIPPGAWYPAWGWHRVYPGEGADSRSLRNHSALETKKQSANNSFPQFGCIPAILSGRKRHAKKRSQTIRFLNSAAPRDAGTTAPFTLSLLGPGTRAAEGPNITSLTNHSALETKEKHSVNISFPQFGCIPAILSGSEKTRKKRSQTIRFLNSAAPLNAGTPALLDSGNPGLRDRGLGLQDPTTFDARPWSANNRFLEFGSCPRILWL